MILFGALLAGIRVIIATVDIDDAVCILGKWLGHLSFAVVFGAMILKTWRVGKVVKSGMKKVRITMTHLQIILAIGLSLFCVYLMIDTVIGVPHKSYDQSFDGHNIIRLIKCTNKNQNITYALFVIEFCLVVVGAKICWSTKDVPDAVNDSKYVAMCK